MIPGTQVTLRSLEPGDAELLWSLATDPAVCSNVVGWDFPPSRHGQEAWIAEQFRRQDTHRLTIVDRDGVAVGITGLWEIDWHNRSALTGVKMLPAHQGKGLAADAVLTTMCWSFNVVGLRRLHAALLDFNARSYALFVDRCGWRVEGREIESIFRGGAWRDLIRIAALKRDFDGRADAAERKRRMVPVAE